MSPLAKAPHSLKQELYRIALLGCGMLLFLASMFSIFIGFSAGLHWLVASSVCWAFVLYQCHKRLHLNRRSLNDSLYPSLGMGNRITLLRGFLIAACAGFLAISQIELPVWIYVIPAFMYSIAAAADWLDGYVARRNNHTSQLGAELDTALDAFGLLIAPLLAVCYGKLHVSYLLVSIAYYVFRLGIFWRNRQGFPVFDLPPSHLRRHLAGAQMVLVAIALWPPIPADLSRMSGIVLMIPLLIGFCRDWLHVSGRIGADAEHSA